MKTRNEETELIWKPTVEEIEVAQMLGEDAPLDEQDARDQALRMEKDWQSKTC